MSGAITPILNLVLEGDADAKGHKILNLDLSGLSSGAPFFDNTALIRGNVDGTKLAHFDLSLIGSAQHRVFQLPNYNGRLATVAGTEDLTNKTINGITFTGTGGLNLNSGILNIDGELSTEGNVFLLNDGNDVTIRAGVATDVTLPASGTLATTLQLPVISNVAYNATTWDGNLDAATKNAIRDKFESLTTELPPFSDQKQLFKNDSDPTKLVKLNLAGLTTGTTRTYVAPNKNGTFALLDDIPYTAGILFGSDEAGRSLSLAGDVAFYGEFTLVGGFGTLFNVTGVTDITFPTTGTLVTWAGEETLTNKTITDGAFSGDVELRSSAGSFYLALGTDDDSSRSLTLRLNDADRIMYLGGNLAINGALTFAGAYAATFTLIGATALTLPTVGAVCADVGVPASSSASGIRGQRSYDSGFLYVCYDADQWGRVALDISFP